MKLWETLLNVILLCTLYIYMDKVEKNPQAFHFVRHRYSLSLHLNHIFKALSPLVESPREESRSLEIMKKELI